MSDQDTNIVHQKVTGEIIDSIATWEGDSFGGGKYQLKDPNIKTVKDLQNAFEAKINEQSKDSGLKFAENAELKEAYIAILKGNSSLIENSSTKELEEAEKINKSIGERQQIGEISTQLENKKEAEEYQSLLTEKNNLQQKQKESLSKGGFFARLWKRIKFALNISPLAKKVRKNYIELAKMERNNPDLKDKTVVFKPSRDRLKERSVTASNDPALDEVASSSPGPGAKPLKVEWEGPTVKQEDPNPAQDTPQAPPPLDSISPSEPDPQDKKIYEEVQTMFYSGRKDGLVSVEVKTTTLINVGSKIDKTPEQADKDKIATYANAIMDDIHNDKNPVPFEEQKGLEVKSGAAEKFQANLTQLNATKEAGVVNDHELHSLFNNKVEPAKGPLAAKREAMRDFTSQNSISRASPSSPPASPKVQQKSGAAPQIGG